MGRDIGRGLEFELDDLRCLDDGLEGLKHKRRCGYKKWLDLETLVCDFPLARVAERLRCPRCGCREVMVMFEPPSHPKVNAAAALPYRQARQLED